MGKSKVCACCEKYIDDISEKNTDEKPLAFSVSLCSKLLEEVEGDPSSGDGRVLPTASGVNVSLTDLVVCQECRKSGTVRTKLPSFDCSCCKEVSILVCTACPSTELGSILEQVKRSWKCPLCYQQPEGKEIKWKCPKCFSKDIFCGSCEKPAENQSHILRCAQCEQMYHYFCAGIKPDKFRGMKSEDKSKWICKTCFMNNVKKIGKDVGKHLAISAALAAITLGGIPLVVGALGFGTAGVAAGSWAALYQSSFLGGWIARGSIFALLQSVGAAGLALSTQAGIATICATLPLLGKLQWKKSKSETSAKDVKNSDSSCSDKNE